MSWMEIRQPKGGVQIFQCEEYGQLTMLDWDASEKPEKVPKHRVTKPESALIAIPYFHLDLSPDHVDLFGFHYWEMRSPWSEGGGHLNTGVAPRMPIRVSLSDILEANPDPKYYLTKTACKGILRRAEERGKPLPPALKKALELQAGIPYSTAVQTEIPEESDEAVGFDGYNGDLTGNVTSTLGTNCGMSTGRNGIMNPVAFAANQRDEVRDLHDVVGALGTQILGDPVRSQCNGKYNGSHGERSRSGMSELSASAGSEGYGTCGDAKQQTFIASGVVSKGNGECFLTEDVHTCLSAGGGQAGQGYPCVMTAGFCAEASADARGVGYQEECAPTLKRHDKGSSILCLNDQGGQFMSCSTDITGTLRSQMNQHQPLILESNQDHARVRTDGVTPALPASMGMGGGHVPMVYENHGIDSRYTGPHSVSPTISARCGTGGNNVPLVGEDPAVYCIMGNAIDREPQNGGNGIGYQKDVAYTITTSDHHAIFSRQRTDMFQENEVVSTESARQHKDATDLVMQPYQDTVGTLVQSDHKGISNQYVNDDKCIVNAVNLIRRLTPLEAERLQGFPDFFTMIPSASDSGRYKALGNSVAIPCVEFVMGGIATAIQSENEKRRRRRRVCWRVTVFPLAA